MNGLRAHQLGVKVSSGIPFHILLLCVELNFEEVNNCEFNTDSALMTDKNKESTRS